MTTNSLHGPWRTAESRAMSENPWVCTVSAGPHLNVKEIV